MPFWFLVSLSVAFAAASEVAVAKRFFGSMSPLHMTAVPMLYSLPISFGMLLLLPWPNEIPAQFWYTLVILLPFNTAGFICHMASVNLSPLSLTMPFLSFTPAVVILTGYLFLGETVSNAGVAGIGLIVAGSYIINLNTLRRDDLLAPFRAILQEQGSRLMLIAAVLYGLCVVLGKKMVTLSSPVFSGTIFFASFALCVLSALRLSGRIRFAPLLHRPLAGFLVAGVSFVQVLLHMWAVSLVQTAYMVSVKRLSGLFSVGFGALVFHETNIAMRLAGAGVMFAGAVLISLWG
ncbi:MAG: EamA family transporter [Desulfovibrio sp.]|uniref:EamA family transporter n=1 Tax=Desulfovibrio sp. 7SRBS1 TaxID=3378064 RepID=UPI003B3E3816